MAEETDTPADEPVPEKPAPTPEAAPEAKKAGATTVAHGTLIMGTYEIERLINSGGMGEVYRGRNIHNEEPVAIKIVLPSLAHDTKIVALFQKESTVLSRLSHEAIVRYHVFTNDPTIGRPCMVMEFVSGQALSDRIEQGPMPVDQVKTMLRRVASGLDKAHRAGVVHRDLSPDNVILEEGSVEHAKLIDFGIAKSSSFGSGTLLQGQFAGKFNWVAPEQLGAFGGVVDGRSDVYSLALVTAAASRGEVLQMGASIVDAVSKRASVPDLTGVDPSLLALLSWMLQPDPGQRCDSMARVIQALDDPKIIPGPPAPAAPDPNKTVIGGALPMLDLPPIPAPPTAPPAAATMIVATAPPARAPTPPPVIAVPDDSSPFGAPTPASAPAAIPSGAAQPAKPASGGKGGLIAAAVVVLAAAGGGAAWFSGAFGPAPDQVVEAPAKPAEPIASEQTAAKDAEAKAAEDKAAADAAAKAAEEQAADEKAAADKLAAEQAAADKLAADKAAAEKAAADQATAEKAAADKAAADKSAADAADPVARQTKHLAALALPTCTHLGLAEPKAEGFVLSGFALDDATLDGIAGDWQSATGASPTLSRSLIDKAHCPALDFAASLPRGAVAALGLSLDSGTEQKGGTAISGKITGAGAKPLTLFLVNEAGGVTEMSPHVTTGGDAAQFSFMLTLPKGAPKTRQLLLALASDDALAAALRDLPAGSDAAGMFAFLTESARDVAGGAQAGLTVFTLEE